MEALIADPARTLLLPVARAEELPVKETTELVDRAREGLSIPARRSAKYKTFVQGVALAAAVMPTLEDQDTAIAVFAHRRAVARGLGTRIDA